MSFCLFVCFKLVGREITLFGGGRIVPGELQHRDKRRARDMNLRSQGTGTGSESDSAEEMV